MRIAIVALAAAACASSGQRPSQDVSGTWCTSNSSGFWPLTLTLIQQDESVNGTGTYHYLNRRVSPPAGWVKVSGTTAGSHISLRIRYEYGATTEYTALIIDGTRMAGLETTTGETDSVRLSRGRCGLVP
jgi:hypothetical protein